MDADPLAPTIHPDLRRAFGLADLADEVTMAHFRDAALTAIRKEDGTPVSQVDRAAEEAMLAGIRHAEPDSAVTGEEVGQHPGTPGRRWIFDGIDGTHNFAEGRPGWGTIIALVDGDGPSVGVVTSPALGRRWWAVRGGGAWTAEHRPGHFDPGAGRRLTCTAETDLTRARVLASPHEGFLAGWRSEAAARFAPPGEVRSRCFAIDAAMVAEGRLDAAVFLYGYEWDYAGPSLLVTEAGGRFRDLWGTARHDTATAVLANPSLVEPIIGHLADLRPEEPDVPRLSSTVIKPLGGGSVEADPWRAFGVSTLPSMSARTRVEHAPSLILDIVDERTAELAQPFRGVTTDGTVRPLPRSLDGPKVDEAAMVEAAQAFLQALTPAQRERASFAIDAAEWRMWLNVHMNHHRHGVMLEDLSPAVRQRAIDLLRATLSARGFDTARTIMRINGLLAELTGDHEAFGEWPYFVSIFGRPGDGQPWGWQIDGHHLCLNTALIEGHMVMTPSFLGAEPRRINEGPLAGTSLFEPEERLGLDLIRSLDAEQRSRAVIHPSIHPDELPRSLQNLFDGRMQAGAFHDNLVAPYQGVAGADLGEAQRRLLLGLADTYVGWSRDDHAAVRRAEVEAAIDETWFSWYGGTGDDDPFYYRVHSPVILIEFDHHPGVAFNNWFPTRHHVHTVVRTPNGGDYGTDLLALHHERYDHRHGHHEPR